MPTTPAQLRQILKVRDEIRERLPIEQAPAPVDPTPLADFAVTKSDDEHRYTFGVLYVPGARDSDNEFADADDLQKAVWEYMRKGYRGVRDTHTDREIGELVELVTWPYEAEVEATTGDGQVFKYRLPANTVYSGVVWHPEAWALVKTGKLRGYSLGGKAVRMKDALLDDALPRMAELLGGGPAPELTPATKDAPLPIDINDRVAWSNDDLTLGQRGTVVGKGVRKSDGAITHHIEWDDGSLMHDVPGFSLRNLKGEADV